MQNSKRPSYRIIVVGGGVAGLAASIGLRRKGHNVIVLESTTELQTMGGSLLIPPSAARVLDSYRIWERFRAAENTPPTHTTFRYDDGKVLESISHAAMESTFGYPIMSVTRARYQRMLYLAAIDEGVEVRLGSRIENINEDIPAVTLISGEIIEGDLIIGADGIRSRVRATVLGGNDVQPVPESMAYQCNISGYAMQSDCLTAPLMLHNPIHSWYGPGRQLICGSNSLGAFYSITLVVYPTASDNIPDLIDVFVPSSNTSYRRGDIFSMRESVEMFEPRVKKFIEMAKPEDCFLWKIAYLPRLNTWVSKSGKVAVLGDAAHAMVPHLGMGAATAVEDGGVLAECIGHASSVADIPSALYTYERIRKPRTERIQAAALAAGTYKAMRDGPEQLERDHKMAERMDPNNPKYEFWKAAGGLHWLYAYNFMDSTKEELDKISSGERKRDKQARI